MAFNFQLPSARTKRRRVQLDTRDARVMFLDREQDEGQSMNMNEERPLEEELDTASNSFIPDEMHNEIEFEEPARHGSEL